MHKVSIIVPCYNQAQFLDECLQSVLNQKYDQWECIIVNDGSPDNTDAVVQKWLEIDSRFQYIKKENEGVSNARNTGIARAKGEFILPLDADDKIATNYLKEALEVFAKDQSLKLVYCKAEKFGEETGKWNLKPFSLEALTSDNMIFCSAIYRKKDWEVIGGYDEKMVEGLEDWEFWISLLKNGGTVFCLDIIGFYYRIKLISRQQEINRMGKEKLFAYLSVKHADFFVSHYGSFAAINARLEKEKYNFASKLKSEKFVIDLFCSTFFNFSIFGKYKKK